MVNDNIDFVCSYTFNHHLYGSKDDLETGKYFLETVNYGLKTVNYDLKTVNYDLKTVKDNQKM